MKRDTVRPQDRADAARIREAFRMRPLDVEGLRVACELSELAYGLHPWHFEPGVRRPALLNARPHLPG